MSDIRVALFVVLSLLIPSCANSQNLAIVGAKIYTSPEAQPVDGTTIVIRDGTITAVGKHSRIPKDTRILSCTGCVVCAGFWNSHVHFSEPKWLDAAHQPAAKLAQQLQQMLTRSGFTTVVDVGSDPNNTIALRRRIETGDVLGPHIYTAGAPLYPPHAIPYYLVDLPPQVLASLPRPSTPAEAVEAVQQNIALGTDVAKLFTGSYVSQGKIVVMPQAIAEAAVHTAHEHGQLVFAHPSNLEGTRVAIRSGVDVLAHAPDTVDGIDDALLHEMLAHRTAMIPTLKLFSGESDIAPIRRIVGRFHQLGGQLIFGTDTGFLTDYDMTEEYRQLALAGLTWRDVLTMLTTAPAGRFRVGDRQGRIAVGMAGDLSVLSEDPAAGDSLAFTHVRYTIRAGRVLFSTP